MHIIKLRNFISHIILIQGTLLAKYHLQGHDTLWWFDENQL